jgi:PAS domain S-box-containing protein
MATQVDSFPELRARAEKTLPHMHLSGAQAMADPARLLHELRDYQVKLQMQHEALVETLAHAEAMRIKNQELYDFAPVAYFTTAPTGHILEGNQAAAMLIGLKPLKLVNRRLQDFFSPDAQPELSKFLSALASTNADGFANGLMLFGNALMPRYVNAKGRACADPARSTRVLRIVLMDVTALKQATDDVVHVLTASAGARSHSH